MTTSTDSNPQEDGLTLYDIAFAPPYEENTAAPNPWKARYALNFKAVPYHTKWIQMPDITRVRRDELHVPPCRKLPNSSDYYTLPVLADSSTGAKIGDSFDIAHYIQKTYPNSGAGDLFPPMPEGRLEYKLTGMMASLIPLSDRSDSDIHADYAKFQHHVDWAFSLHAQLMSDGMKWDPQYEEGIKAEFMRRAGRTSWDEMTVHGEAREKLLASLQDTVKDLAFLFQQDTSGPFLLGGQPSHADIIVGGWLRMMNKTLPENEWEQIQSWHDGVFGKLHAVLQERFGSVKV